MKKKQTKKPPMLVETEFSKFFRMASPEEQQKVFSRVIDKAIDDQRKVTVY